MFSRIKLFYNFIIRRISEKTELLGYPARKWQCVFPTLAPTAAINVAKLYLDSKTWCYPHKTGFSGLQNQGLQGHRYLQ